MNHSPTSNFERDPFGFNGIYPTGKPQSRDMLYPNLGSGDDTIDRKPVTKVSGTARKAMSDVIPREVTDVTDDDGATGALDVMDDFNDK